MATYTRDKTNKKPVFGGGVPSTTQELAKSVAQKEVANKPQMAQGQPKSPLAGAAGNMQSIANKGPIPAGTQLDQSGVQKFNTGNRPTFTPPSEPIQPGQLEDPRQTFEKNAAEAAQKKAAIEAAKAEARRKMEEQAKHNAAELAARADLDGDGKIGSGIESVGGGREMTEEDAINTAIRNLITEQPDVAAEREAMIGEMEAKEARDIQSMRARTGLGGMGLTGAAGALESQVRQESGREQALTTAQFDRAAREEALKRLLAGVDLRRSEQVFEKAMELFGKEEGAAIPPLDGNGDGTITDEERAAHRAAIEQAATTAAAESGARASAQDTARSAEIEGMSSSAFEDGVNEKELKRLGWTIAGPKGSEDGRWYYEWTSPNGVVKRAFVDDAFEFSSGGLEWA